MSWGDEGLLWSAVTEAVEPIVHLETECDRNKLEKRIRDCFNKGAKGLELGRKDFEELVNDYADAAFSSLFSSLGDRDWLPQADFLLVIDAGVKDHFPPPLLKTVPQLNFERAVLQASDRAFDEGRYQMTSWETVKNFVQGAKTQKKVRECCDEGRAEAVKQGLEGVQDFVSAWIYTTIELLAQKCQGDPESALDTDTACQIFDNFCQGGGLPLNMVEQDGLPPAGWPIIEQCVAQAYAPFAGVNQGMEFGGLQVQMPMKGGKGKRPGKFSPY